MFDLGWQEFLLVAIIAVIVVGPKDLPRVVRSVSQWVRKARSMAREFQSSLEEVAREAELDDVRKDIQGLSKDGIGKTIEKQIDPDGTIRGEIDEARKSTGADEIEKDLKELEAETKAPAWTPATPHVPPTPTETSPAEAPSAGTPSAEPAPPRVESADDYAAQVASGTAKPATPELAAVGDPSPEKPVAAAASREG
jgi:sec-independent protein translocase protein TatB